jgi:hypothetical protein
MLLKRGTLKMVHFKNRNLRGPAYAHCILYTILTFYLNYDNYILYIIPFYYNIIFTKSQVCILYTILILGIKKEHRTQRDAVLESQESRRWKMWV